MAGLCGDALERGAAACLVERGREAFARATHGRAAGLKAATGLIAANGLASRALVLAVTGTNGKTSTAWWLAHGAIESAAEARPCAWWARWVWACRAGPPA
jgi:UDP-N-acetylmuramoyl-L-alanyl-D-glutamate--2,6-diaminopimelate ligase